MQTECTMNKYSDTTKTIRLKLKDQIKSLALHIDIIKNKQHVIDNEYVRNCQIEIAKIKDLEIELLENEQKVEDLLHQDSHSSEFISTTVNTKSIIGLKIENDRLQNEIIKTRREIDLHMKINSKLEKEVLELTQKNTDCRDAMDTIIELGINTLDVV